MSDELEAVANSLYDNQVPKMWADKGFLSLKPLGSWAQDLNDRYNGFFRLLGFCFQEPIFKKFKTFLKKFKTFLKNNIIILSL
jgi:hypothetical protein